MLGLDQKTLRPLSPGADDGSVDTDEQDENERIDRERLAWTCKFQIFSAALKSTTYFSVDCYIFDRRCESVPINPT